MTEPLISIITPVYNGAQYLRATIESVLQQTYQNFEYIIVDGGSTDGTIDIVNRFSNHISKVISEPDNGMYDALAKGLQMAQGDIVAYINAGDLYHEAAFSVVVDVMSNYDVSWLTGMRVFLNEQSQIIHCDQPISFKKQLIRAGAYGRWLPFIQQESTFWRRELHEQVDFVRLREMQLAGDYYLWYSFAKEYNLAVVASHLGGFRSHENQLSSNLSFYLEEQRSFCDRMTILSMMQILVEIFRWFIPVRWRRNNQLFRFNREIQKWTNH